MAKIYVLMEISSASQLRKTNHDVLDMILEQIDLLCANNDGSLLRHQRDLFFYMFSQRESELRGLLEGLMAVFMNAQEKQDELQGVSLFADRIEDETDTASFEICRERLYQSGGADCFHLGEGLEEPAKFCSFDLKKTANLLKATSRIQTKIFPKPDISSILYRENMINRVLEILIPEINTERENRLVHIFGPAGAGKVYNVRRAAERLAGGGQGVFWVRIPPVFSECRPEDPFIKSMNKDFLVRVPEYLSSLEKGIWSEKLNAIRGSQGDRDTTDFILMYQLYLLAYERYMAGLLLPPLFICESMEGISPASMELLVRFCIEFLGRASIIPILISESRKLDFRLEPLPKINLRVRSMSQNEIERKISKNEESGLVPAEGIELYDGDVYRFILASGVLGLGGQIHPEFGRTETTLRLVTKISPAAAKVLLAYVSAEYIPGVNASEIIENLGLPHVQETAGREECLSLGLIDEEDSFWFRREEVFAELTGRLAKVEGSFLAEYANILVPLVKPGIRGVEKEILSFVCTYADLREVVKLAAAAVDDLLDRGKVDGVTVLLEGLKPILLKRAFTSDRFYIDLFLASLELRLGVVERDLELCRQSLIDVDEIDELREKEAAARYQLEYARYLYIVREFRKSLAASKRALFLLEDSPEDEMTGIANAEVGLAMMSLGKTGEAAEYFTLATEPVQTEKQSRHRGRGMVLEAAAEFILGGFDRSLILLRESERLFSGAGIRGMELFSVFFIGRVYFCLGMYHDAAASFSKALNLIELYGLYEAAGTVYAWLARSEVYMFQPAQAVKILKGLERNYETGLFLSEAYYMSGNIVEGCAVLTELSEHPEMDAFQLAPGEVIDWQNGFSNLEDRALSSPELGSVLSHLVRGFRSYLLGRTGNKGEAEIELLQLTRDDKLGEYDPNNMLFYFFAADLLVFEEEDEEINRLTLLSKALKYLQGTASRIADPKLKQAYLWKNYWNAKLMTEGRNQKLV